MKIFYSLTLSLTILLIIIDNVRSTYRYPRRRFDRGHLRMSEYFKADHMKDDTKYYTSSQSNRTYEYFENNSPRTSTITYDQLVFETIDKINENRLSPFYIYTYDNQEDRRLSSDPNLVSLTQCRKHVEYLVKSLKNKTSNYQQQHENYDYDHEIKPELAAFFDSYAKQEAGVLLGNVYWTGDHHECTSRHIFDLDDSTTTTTVEALQSSTGGNDDNVIDFKARYCVASLRSPKWYDMSEEKLRIKKNFFKSQSQRYDYSKLFRLQLGICLPETCDSTSLEYLKDELTFLTTSKLESPFKHYDLFELYCLPDETSPLRKLDTSASLFVWLICIWLSIIALATYRDLTRQQPREIQCDGDRDSDTTTKIKTTRPKSTIDLLVEVFSFRINYNKFMHVEKQQQQQQQPAHDSSIINANNNNSNNKDQQPDLIAVVNKQQQPSNAVVGEHQDTGSGGDTSENEADQQIEQPNRIVINRQDIITTTNSKTTGSSSSSSRATLELDLRFLNAIKAMAMLWIINSHIMLLTAQTTKNVLDCDGLLNILIHFFIGGTFGVDLFFTLTGFLAAYLLFHKGQAYKLNVPMWLYLFFHRYWRLAPMYLMAFWFSKSVVQHLGSGPLWDYGSSNITFRGLCNHESWWYPATLTSNFLGIYDECMMTSWYVSCDMQFWLASPIIIYLLAKSPRLGWSFSLSMIAASCALRFNEIYTSEVANYLEMVRPRADVFRRVGYDIPRTYTHPQYRISTYIVGMLAGHFVYMIQSGKWQSSMFNSHHHHHHQDHHRYNKQYSVLGVQLTSATWRSLIAYTGLFLATLMSTITYSLSHFYPESWNIHARVMASTFHSIDHLFMGLGVSMVFVTMSFGQWKAFKNLISHPFLIRISRVNYALLLLQCEAIYYQVFRYNTIPTVGTREILSILLNLFVSLYPVALLVTVLIEYPLANLEKEFVANKIIAASRSNNSRLVKESTCCSATTTTTTNNNNNNNNNHSHPQVLTCTSLLKGETSVEKL